MFTGIKIADFGTALSAPYAAMMLADLGATVLKIEKPRRGDLTRSTDAHVRGESGYFLGMNRGKQGMTLDVRTPRGQEIARQISREADVVLHNFRPGMMEKWGLGYEDIKRLKSDTIYCAISGFGDSPGHADRTANDIVAQASAGITALTGEPGRMPVKAGVPVTDSMTGCIAALGIASALYRRATTGQGSLIETSLIDGAYALMPNFTASVLNGSPRLRRAGDAHPQLAPYESYQGSDENWFVIGVFHQNSWDRLCATLGRPELLEHPLFVNNSLRVSNRELLRAELNKSFSTQTRDTWVDRLNEEGVPCAAILEVEESFARFAGEGTSRLIHGVDSPVGQIDMLSSPLTVDGKTMFSANGVPGLGEHNEAILSTLGVSAEEITQLHEDRII